MVSCMSPLSNHKIIVFILIHDELNRLTVSKVNLSDTKGHPATGASTHFKCHIWIMSSLDILGLYHYVRVRAHVPACVCARVTLMAGMYQMSVWEM